MSLDPTKYPNRKDHRRPYRRSARFDRSCRPHGGCGWCFGNRKHNDRRRAEAAEASRREMERADDWWAEYVEVAHDLAKLLVDVAGRTEYGT